MKFKSTAECWKIAKLPNFLIETANKLKLEIRIIYIDKGWIKEKVYYEIEGDEEKINKFKLTLIQTTNQYNN